MSDDATIAEARAWLSGGPLEAPDQWRARMRAVFAALDSARLALSGAQTEIGNLHAAAANDAAEVVSLRAEIARLLRAPPGADVVELGQRIANWWVGIVQSPDGWQHPGHGVEGLATEISRALSQHGAAERERAIEEAAKRLEAKGFAGMAARTVRALLASTAIVRRTEPTQAMIAAGARLHQADACESDEQLAADMWRVMEDERIRALRALSSPPARAAPDDATRWPHVRDVLAEQNAGLRDKC